MFLSDLNEFITTLSQLKDFKSKWVLFIYAFKRHGLFFMRSKFKRQEILINTKDFSFTFMAFSGEFLPYREIYIRKDYERIPEFTPKSGEIIIDIGSNIGLFAISRAIKGAKVYSFDPNPSVFERLTKNITLNNFQDKIVPVNKGMHSSSGEISFYIDPQSSIVGSINPPDKTKATEIKVEVTTVDDFVKTEKISQIDILKIDAECNEVPILNGAQESLTKVKKIVMEYHSDEIKKEVLDFFTKYPNFKLIEGPELILYAINQDLKD